MLVNPEAVDSLLFPVREVPVQAVLEPEQESEFFAQAPVTQIPTERYKAIVRTDTDEVISIVSDKYQLVPNSDFIEPILDEIDRRPEFGQVEIANVEDYHFGRKSHFDLIFKDEVYTPPDNHDIAYRLNITGSYDGTTRASLTAGAWRLICTNGMILGVKDWTLSQRHKGNVADFLEGLPELVCDSVDGGARAIGEFVRAIMYAQFDSKNEKYREYESARRLDNDDDKPAVTHLRRALPYLSPRQARQALPILREGDMTPWDQYNALTDFVTHYEHGRLTEAKRTHLQLLVSRSIKGMVYGND